jgi:hypothetical protein
MTEMVELLSQLLIQLSSQDNKGRQEAELQLDQHWVINQPAHLLVGLAHIVVSHPDAYVRIASLWKALDDGSIYSLYTSKNSFLLAAFLCCNSSSSIQF